MSISLASASRVPGLVCDLRSDSQSVTVYLRGAPFCTVQRKRVTDRTPGKPWTAYDLSGARIAEALTPTLMVARVERCAAWLLAFAPYEVHACTVELAPDYMPRALRLCVIRTADGKEWQLGGVTLDGSHLFARLRYLGAPLAPFRTRGEAWDFCALVGLTPAMPTRCAGRTRYLDAPHASPVACVGGVA